MAYPFSPNTTLAAAELNAIIAAAFVAISNRLETSTLGAGVATFLATPSSANLLAALTTKTGTGNNVFATNPALVTPDIGAATGTSLTLSGPGSLLPDQIYDHDEICTTQLDKASSTSMSSIVGLDAFSLVAGKTYVIEGWLSATAGAAGGIKLTLNSVDGATATTFCVNVRAFNGTTVVANTTTTTFSNDILNYTNVVTDIYISGAIIVNAAGTMRSRMAQNVSDAATTSVFIGSRLSVRRIN